MQSEKLQKVLARAGLAARRTAESWIVEGRVMLNGRVAQLGCRVSAKDQICVDGRRIAFPRVEGSAQSKIIMYHKPMGEVTTRSDPKGRPTVFARLPKLQSGRWISVGRLDITTTGLLLLTNNGDWAHRLMHPSAGLAREYAVRVLGAVKPDTLKRLVQGVMLEDGPARFEHIVDSGGRGANHWYHVVLMTGRHHLVHRLWESQGLRVSRLKRVRFGPIFLETSLRPGQWKELGTTAVKQLMQAA